MNEDYSYTLVSIKYLCYSFGQESARFYVTRKSTKRSLKPAPGQHPTHNLLHTTLNILFAFRIVALLCCILKITMKLSNIPQGCDVSYITHLRPTARPCYRPLYT